jgi:hypothetical protein
MPKSVLIGALILLIGATSAVAQEPVEDRVEDIIVVARRSDAPVWEVSRGEQSLILVGSIRGIPRDFEWNPAGLEQATARADRVLYPPTARISPADIFRLIWRGRTVSQLPEGTTSADYLEASVQGRLEAVMADEGDDWRTRSFFLLGINLMNDHAGFERRSGRDAEDTVREAARRARIGGQSVGTVRGDEIVDNLITQPPGVYAPCIGAAVAAAEAGAETFHERASDWRSRRVPEVMANPLDIALGQCWPWGDPEIGPQLRGQWLTALSEALEEPGVTLAVAPLRLLAEPGGVLDGLEADGFEITGPEWRGE